MWLMAVAGGRATLRIVEPVPERRLLERMAAGDGDALGELYDIHARAVYSLALRILRSQSDAEDIVQEVFANTWRHASQFDDSRGKVAGWLLMQAKRRSIERLRTRRLDTQPGDTTPQEPVDTTETGDVQIVRGEQATRVRRALEELPTLQKTALELAYYEGLTHVQIAEQLEQPLGMVSTRIREGLLRLRQALSGEKTHRSDSRTR